MGDVEGQTGAISAPKAKHVAVRSDQQREERSRAAELHLCFHFQRYGFKEQVPSRLLKDMIMVDEDRTPGVSCQRHCHPPE